MTRVPCLNLVATLVSLSMACGHTRAAATGDAATAGDGPTSSDAANHNADGGSNVAGDGGSAGPSSVDCFYDWPFFGSACPAPTITAAYLSTDCDGTTGSFVVGTGFESLNTYDYEIAAEGPTAVGSNNNRWNVLTPTLLCLTNDGDPATYSGFQLQLENPDGKLSNTVAVQNLLTDRPALVSDDSNDPFDPDACLDAGMTNQQAATFFAPGATTASIGTTDLVTRSRTCDTATGCMEWGATTNSSITFGLATANDGSVIDLTVTGGACGAIDEYEETWSISSCTGSPGVAVHVAAHCLSAWNDVQSSPAQDGSYTETISAALLRY